MPVVPLREDAQFRGIAALSATVIRAKYFAWIFSGTATSGFIEPRAGYGVATGLGVGPVRPTRDDLVDFACRHIDQIRAPSL